MSETYKNIEMQVLGTDGKYETIYPIVTTVIEQNKNLQQKFWRGTQEEYNAIEVKDEDMMYIVTDGSGEPLLNGDMFKSVYDTENKETDIFKYVDEHSVNIPITSTPSKDDTIWIDPSEEGDNSWYTKEETLSDDTRALLGIESESNPDNAFAKVSQNLSNINVELVKKADKTQLCNPNLLDGWYFGNPVDQRSGKIIPAGVPYYKNETQIGVTDKAYPYTDCFYIDGESYWTTNDNIKRGYTGAGYTIDRFCIIDSYNTMTVCIEDGCLHISNPSETVSDQSWFVQYLENVPASSVVTLSVLVESVTGTVLVRGGKDDSHTTTMELHQGLNVFTTEPDSTYKTGFWLVAYHNSDIKIKAAKLELGIEQTLAHQDASGNWQLNEIPNYHDEFLKCIQSTADPSDSYSNKVVVHTGNINQQTVDKAQYAVDNEDYTAKLRNQGLTPTEITPVINGRIQWQYG